jgi:hypothetical protein
MSSLRYAERSADSLAASIGGSSPRGIWAAAGEASSRRMFKVAIRSNAAVPGCAARAALQSTYQYRGQRH